MTLTSSYVTPLETFFFVFLFRYKIEFFAAFVLIFVGRRLYRAIRGGKYTTRGLIISPLMYLFFTSFTFVGLSISGLLICSISFAFGLGLSNVLKGQLHFFERGGQLYYKRSILIVVGWTAAFVFRVYIFIFYDITVGLILSVILSYITGLIIGEAFQIAVQKRLFDYSKTHRTQNQVKEQEQAIDNH